MNFAFNSMPILENKEELINENVNTKSILKNFANKTAFNITAIILWKGFYVIECFKYAFLLIYIKMNICYQF